MGDRAAGEVMFEAHLSEHGYDSPEHEPDLGTVKRPDYVIESDGHRCVVEVREFDPATRSFPDRPFGSTDLATVLKPVRGQIREAARQLKDVSHLGMPLGVMLTNPHGAFVIMGTNEMVWAMHGDPIVMMDIDREVGAAVGEPRQMVPARRQRDT